MKRMAVLRNNIISNFAVWDGVQAWNPESSTKGDVTSFPYVKLNDAFHERSGSYTYNVVIDGNSIARAGAQSVKGCEDAVTAAGLTSNDCINMARDGYYTTILTSSASTYIDPLYESALGSKNIIIFWEGTNDLALNAQTDTQAYNNIKTYCQARKTKGFKVIVVTILPRVGGAANQETYRTSVNSLIKANAINEGWADKVADVGGAALLQTPSNTTYYYDGLHLTDAGQAVARDVIKSALQAVL